MELSQKIAIARGDEPADFLLTNLQLINVHTGEIYPTEIAIAGSRIVGVGKGYAAKKLLDLGGRYVAPGFIDAHVHIESSLCTPPEFAKAVLRRGVTTVITDPHEIANVLGLEGIRFMLNAAKYNPLSMFVMASSCVPATHMETSGAALEAEDLEGLLNNKWVLGLAEMMNYPGVVFADSQVLQKIEMFEQKVLDGHCPGLTGKHLNAYRVAGIRSDHECTTVEEAREKLRAGMVIFIREATNARNLETLLPVVTPENSRRICFCTDDRQPADLLDQGSIDYMVRVAIQHGVSPIDAIRMATLNTAEYFRLQHSGAVAPGYFADLVVFSDLKAPAAEMVFRSGELVVEHGELVATFMNSLVTMRSSINVQWDSVNLEIPAQNGARIRVIGSVEGQLVTDHRIDDAKVSNGLAVADVERDILKMVVIERHTANGHVGKGLFMELASNGVQLPEPLPTIITIWLPLVQMM